jgi:hypothetical protein
VLSLQQWPYRISVRLTIGRRRLPAPLTVRGAGAAGSATEPPEAASIDVESDLFFVMLLFYCEADSRLIEKML